MNHHLYTALLHERISILHRILYHTKHTDPFDRIHAVLQARLDHNTHCLSLYDRDYASLYDRFRK